MMILNLTQHPASAEQIAAGVVEPKYKSDVKSLLTFNDIPTLAEIHLRAVKLAGLVEEEGYSVAMIGGAPYLMSELERELKERSIKPVYAFSQRVSKETKKEDGTVEKTSVFQHVGFVEV